MTTATKSRRDLLTTWALGCALIIIGFVGGYHAANDQISIEIAEARALHANARLLYSGCNDTEESMP